MGATRESSCSEGILEGWLGKDAGVCEGDDIYAKVSPGKRTRVQRVATRDRTVAPLVLEVMEPLSIPTGQLQMCNGTSAEVSALFLCKRQERRRCLRLHSRSVPILRHLAESTGGVVAAGRCSIGTCT